MRKNLLFFLMAMLLPCLAWADNKAIQKTIPASYYQLQDNRLVVSANAAGITLPQTAGNSYAVAQWINPTSVNYSYGGVLMDYGTYEHMNFNGNWCLSVDKDAVLKINGHGSDNHGVGGVGSLGVTINFNEWNYLLSQYDAETKTMSVYINGEKAFSKTFDYDVYYPWSDGSFHFGGFGLAALIDEVHVFNKALTDDEVKQAYKNPTKMASLTALYTLDEETPTGKFANSAANAAEGTEATWVLYKGQSYWDDGIVTGSESAASPTLVDGRAASSYTFVVPSSDPEHLSLVMYIIDGNIYSSLFQPGEEVSVEPGTEVTVNATVAAGFVVAALTVDGIEVDLTYEDDEVTGKFIINSNLDENSIVWTVTRIPYEITIENPENAVITVKNGDAVVESGDMIPAGTELTLSAVCTDGYSVSSYLLNGQPVEGTTVEVPEEAFTISANVATIDYCESTAKVSRTDRYITSLNVNGETVEGLGNTANRNLFVDRTSTIVTVSAGDDVTLTTSGGGEWMHSYIYVDFDKNGWTVDETLTRANGDLVWFNCYSLQENVTPFYNSAGEALASGYAGIDGVVGTFNVPIDIEPGDYRVRYKLDWNCTDPCGNSATGNLITANSGAIVDFTLRVESPYLENERTITIASSDPEAGTVEFVQPESDELSVSTALKKVIVKATPAEGAEFLGWYKADVKLSEDAQYVIEDTEDLSIQANFVWSANYTVTIEQPENGEIIVKDGETVINSGDEVLANTTLTLSATANSGYMFQNFIVNGEETTETTVVVRENLTIGANIAEGVEYCELNGSKTNGRVVSALEISNGEVSETITTSGTTNTNVYGDFTDSKFTVEPGSTVTITSTGSGEWMHTYVYVDFDRNGWNVDETIQGVNGDLVWYNAYSLDNTNYNDSDGNKFTTSGNAHNKAIGGQTATFTVPADTPAGEYRVRYKTDWNCSNPCGRWSSLGYDGNYINANNGNIIDFTLVVESAQLSEARTIAVEVAEDQEEMGEVSLPGNEGTSVTTTNRYVTILAEAFEGAQFLNWTRDGEVVSTEAELVVSDLTDATYVANFGWTVSYTIGANGSFQIKAEGTDTPLQSGVAVAPGTKLIATATPDTYKVIDEFTDNGHDLEVVDGVAEIIVTGPVNINVTFKDEAFALSIVTEGNGTVEVWTGFDDNDEPAGEKIENNGEINVRTDYAVYVMPAAEGENSEEITFVLIKNGNEEDITLDNFEDYGWNCAYNENYLLFPIEATGNLSVEAHFTTGMAAIGDIIFDGIEGEVEYYNLQGVRVDAENVQTGFYIVRKGDKAVKMFIRK